MKLNSPITENGKEYSNIAVNLSLSTMVTEPLYDENKELIREGAMSNGINIRLIPYSDKCEILRGQDIVKLLNSSNMSVAEQECYNSIISAIEKLMSK
jgi:hypothetical protein